MSTKIHVETMTKSDFFMFILALDKLYTRSFAKRVFEANCHKFGIDPNKISASIVVTNTTTIQDIKS